MVISKRGNPSCVIYILGMLGLSRNPVVYTTINVTQKYEDEIQ